MSNYLPQLNLLGQLYLDLERLFLLIHFSVKLALYLLAQYTKTSRVLLS